MRSLCVARARSPCSLQLEKAREQQGEKKKSPCLTPALKKNKRLKSDPIIPLLRTLIRVNDVILSASLLTSVLLGYCGSVAGLPAGLRNTTGAFLPQGLCTHSFLFPRRTAGPLPHFLPVPAHVSPCHHPVYNSNVPSLPSCSFSCFLFSQDVYDYLAYYLVHLFFTIPSPAHTARR